MKKLLFLIVFMPSAGLAEGRYDGSWSVSIHTQAGTCDPVSYAYVDVVGTTVVVHNAFSGSRAHSAAGYISAKGYINTTVQNVQVHGRLGSQTGSGTWVSLNKQCRGVWSSYNRSH